MYKKIILWSIVMSVNLMAFELNVLVDKVDIKKGGNIAVYIFQKDGFPISHKEALFKKVKIANSENIAFKFDIPTSIEEIAIKVHHDENADTKVTKNWTGIYPKEGLGFSNKQKLGVFGPPSYKSSKIKIKDLQKSVSISVIYQ